MLSNELEYNNNITDRKCLCYTVLTITTKYNIIQSLIYKNNTTFLNYIQF